MPFHHLPAPSEAISLAVYCLPSGGWPTASEGWDQTACDGCPAGTPCVRWYLLLLCSHLLSLLLIPFPCSKSSNPLFLPILISLINQTPKRLNSTSVKLEGCKFYFKPEEELEVPKAYGSFPALSAGWLQGILPPYEPSLWIFHTVLFI